MGLFNHRTASSSHSRPQSQSQYYSHSQSQSMDTSSSSEQQQQFDGRSSSSSSRSTHSTHSTHSNTTVKGHGSRVSASIPIYNHFAHAVGGVTPSHPQYQSDVDMSDSMYSTQSHSHADGHQSHAKRSQPVPPSRTSSLGHLDANAMMMSSTQISPNHLPHSTPVAPQSLKKTRGSQASLASSSFLSPSPRSQTLGHGSLELTEVDPVNHDDHFIFPVPGQSHSGDLTNHESDDDDGDAEETAKRREERRAAQEKAERTREQGRIRQARKREKDRAKKHAKSKTADQIGIMFEDSANTSTASLAPLSMPNASSSTTPPLATSTSTSSFLSSMPTSASLPSPSQGAPLFELPWSQQSSGVSSPTTAFSMTAGDEAQIRSYGNRKLASKSAVDVRTSSHSSARKHKPPPPIIVPNSSHSTSAKRRRSEPEPELFKREFGLGVVGIGIAENDPMEMLDSPHKPSIVDNYYSTTSASKERPGIRRTTSESAAVMMNMSTGAGPGSRSPTPPPLLPPQRAYWSSVDHSMPSSSDSALPSIPTQPSKDGMLFAQTIASFLPNSKHSAVRKAVSSLGITSQDLSAMLPDLAACYDKHNKLEKRMKDISLEDQPYHSRSISAYTSHANTPLHESATLSTTSTCSSSPTTTRVNLQFGNALPAATASMHSLGTIPTASGSDQETQTNSTTPKGKSPAPNRARSLSSASMRGKGFKAIAKLARSPVVPLYAKGPLISPMSSTTFQFPNTPSVNRMQGSDGASPMMSSVQTPNTGQSVFFNHEEIEATTAAGQTGFGGGGDGGIGENGGDGGHHQRSATDPMGSKVYHPTSRSSQPFTTFPTSGGADHHRSTYHRPSATSISTSSGLSSPMDMMHFHQHSHSSSFSQMGSTQPPPHLYHPSPSTPSDNNHIHSQSQLTQVPFNDYSAFTQQHLSTPSSQNPNQTHRPQTHHGGHSHGHTSSIGTQGPFTPTLMAQNHALSHAHRPSYPGPPGSGASFSGTGSMWQPNPFTPVAEQGTPTRPSPHPSTSHTMLGQPLIMGTGTGAGTEIGTTMEAVRHGDLDQRMLSPNPIPLSLESPWGGFAQQQQPQAQSHIGHDMGHVPFNASDPFTVSHPNHHPSS